MLFRLDLFMNLFLEKHEAYLFVWYLRFLEYVLVFEEELPAFSYLLRCVLMEFITGESRNKLMV